MYGLAHTGFSAYVYGGVGLVALTIGAGVRLAAYLKGRRR